MDAVDREANQVRVSSLLAVSATSTNVEPVSLANASNRLTKSSRARNCGTMTSRSASSTARAMATAMFLARTPALDG